MTEPTPRTENTASETTLSVGRTVADIRKDIYRNVGDDYPLLGLLVDFEHAIEAEAREQDVLDVPLLQREYQRGRADALREAAERVRALITNTDDPYCCVPRTEDAIRAILSEPKP